jgi:murein DD-endopeptidase MepM/ murein hydrolase activator NlpD
VDNRRRAASLAVAATIVTGLPGGPPLGAIAAPDDAQAFGLTLERRPVAVFPLRARPDYGDGLGAGRAHEGVDLFAPAGTAEVAISDGVVLEAAAGDNGGRGNYVSVYDPAADRTYSYFHMLRPPLITRGERVRAGQKLGELGCSGSCWGDHLHFELRRGRDPYGPVLDPLPLLKRLSRGAAQASPAA